MEDLHQQPYGEQTSNLNNIFYYNFSKMLFYSIVEWITTDADKSNMVNTFKFIGASMTRGLFFQGGFLTFAIGAPKDINYRGAVYVCKVNIY